MIEFCYSTEIPCPPGEKTNDAQGRCCVFPFTYGGKIFNSCTTYANGNTLWCSFDATYIGRWADCGKEKTGKVLITSKLIKGFFAGARRKGTWKRHLFFVSLQT